jgi:hypothetical protein
MAQEISPKIHLSVRSTAFSCFRGLVFLSDEMRSRGVMKSVLGGLSVFGDVFVFFGFLGSG